MLITIPQVLKPEAVADMRRKLEAAEWVDGNVTSGRQSALAKHNKQLPEQSAAAREAGAAILDALEGAPLFVAAALPLKVFPPLFNRYAPGDDFGMHVDNALRVRHDGQFRIRADLSATLFLSGPDEYDGGELVIEDTYGGHSAKADAGDMVLYPASSLHRVMPLTRGVRMASFFWIQSMVRDDARRALLFEADMSIQRLAGQVGLGDPSIVAMTGVYHNLLRMWAEL